MARVLEDDIVFRLKSQNFSELSFKSTDTDANSVSNLKQILQSKTKHFHISGNGFSIFYLSSLTQILIWSLEW